MPSPHACCTYDFTLFDELTPTEVRSSLKDLCKKYCFQLEVGEQTQRRHFQGRMSLKVKKRQNEVIKLLKEQNWSKYHISVTSTENRDNNFYVCKEDTRIEGPFTDENDVYIPKDIRDLHELHPWQRDLRNNLKRYDERIVDIVYDSTGNIGKSTLTRYMMLYDDAELLPFCNDYKDIMRMAFDVGPKKTYLIDMPRAINKEKLFQFFAGIETLKSGYCYDDRYKFNKRLFDRPRICIFTNVMPERALLSKDMWKLWTVVNNELVPHNAIPDKPVVTGDTVVDNSNNTSTNSIGATRTNIADLTDDELNDLLIGITSSENTPTVPDKVDAVIAVAPQLLPDNIVHPRKN